MKKVVFILSLLLSTSAFAQFNCVTASGGVQSYRVTGCKVEVRDTLVFNASKVIGTGIIPVSNGGTGVASISALLTSLFPSGAPASYTAGTGISLASNIITNTAPDQTVVLTAGNRISITGTYPNFTISYVEPTINSNVSHTLNSNFTVSTKQSILIYTVTCSATNPLLVGTSSATAFLEYSVNSGTTWLPASNAGNSNGVGVAVAVALTNGQTGTLVGGVPASALVRIRTVTTGTASVTYVTGQEIY